MTGEKRGREIPCQCPYCNERAQASLPFCQACGSMVIRCRQCGKVLAQGETACPGCGAEVRSAPPPEGAAG